MPEARVIQLRPDDDEPRVPPSSSASWEEQVAGGLEFLRRRLTGDYDTDEFGFDADLTDHVLLPLLRPLFSRWFRVETHGVENVPDTGGGLVVANHSGTVPLDAMMATVALHDDHPARRRLRLLGADLVFDLPVIGSLSRKLGSTLACNEDAERLLTGGELVGVFPEGFKGIGKPFRERYTLQRFGRGGFVTAALRTGAPIIPCAIVPEWFATISAPPSAGTFSIPRTSTRNQCRYSGRSRFITTTSVNSASKPNSSTS